MQNCNNCVNRTYDENFGKYVCVRFSHVIRDPYLYDECPGYEKKPIDSKPLPKGESK